MKTSTKTWLALFAFLAIVAVMTAGYAAATARAEEETSGTITNLFPDQMKLVIADRNGQRQDFDMDEHVKVYLNDAEVALEELRIGDRVAIVYWIDEATWYATEVRCQR